MPKSFISFIPFALLSLVALLTARPLSAQGCTLVDCPNQAPTVSIAVSPTTPLTPNVTITTYFSDEEGLSLGSWQLWINGTEQSWWYGQAVVDNPGGTNRFLSATGSYVLPSQSNTIRARMCDVGGACGEQTITIEVAPPPPPPPLRGTPYATLMQRTDARSIGAGASLGYSTPVYYSLDAPRGLALAYSSEIAEAKAVVEVDATINSQTTPTRVSFEVLPNGGGSPLSISYFLGTTGAMRLASRFDASCPGGEPVCAIKVDLRVSAHYAIAGQSDSVKSWTMPGARLMLLNPSKHPYGRGWTLAGAERLFAQSDGGVVHWDGASGLSYFARISCTGSGETESCDYTSPQGDFTTLARRPIHSRYGTRYFRVGRGGDSTFFSNDGLLLNAKARFRANMTKLEWASDALGTRVTTITDPMQRVITLAYESSQGGSGYQPGTLRYITLPDGRRSEVRIDATTSNLVRIDGPDGVTDLLPTYVPGTNRVQSWSERVGGGSVEYDARGLLTMIKGIAVSFEGGTGADSMLLSSALGASLARAQTSYATATHAPLAAALAADSSVATDGSVAKLWRNASGLPERTYARGALGDTSVTTVTYNYTLQPLAVQTTARAPVTYVYSGYPVPLLSSVTDGGSGATTSYTYGPFDQPKTVHVNGNMVSEAFFANATTLAPDSVRSDTANTVRFKYDLFGRVLSTRDKRQVLDTITVDGTHGNTLSRTTSGPGVFTRTVTNAYDVAGRVEQVTDHLGRVSRIRYDSVGRVTHEVRLATATAPEKPDTVLYTFNDATRTYTMRDPLGNLYTNVGNLAGRLVTSVDPRGQSTTYGNDRRGALVRTTDRRGVIVRDSLDALGRVVRRAAGSDTTFFAYDPAKRWVAVRNAESTDTVFVDAAGRPTLAVTMRGGVRYELLQGWVGDLPDGVTVKSYTTPNSSPVWTRSIGSGYDAMRRARVLQDFGGGATTTTFDAREMERTITLPGGVATRTNTIGDLGELKQQAYAGAAGMLTRTYQHDWSSRIAQIERGGENDNTKRLHNYDSRDRLKDYRDVHTWTETIWEPWDPYGDCPGCMIQTDITHADTLRSAAYEYDRNGNPKGAGIVVDSLGNRLVTFEGATFTYDAEGNLLQRSGGAMGTVSYTWNGLGQLVQVVSSVQGTTTYGYDGWGRRARKTVNGSITQYLVHNDQVMMEVSAANGVLAEYTYYPGTDRPHGMRRGGQQYYFAQDAQGNVYGVMNPNGSVVETYEYTPQGAPLGSGSSVVNPYRWKGREWDAEAGLYYVRARYYDPSVGRFISEDPIGTAGGLNVFAYGESDPVNSFDPTGLFPGPCPPQMIGWGYRTVVSGMDGGGNPTYSCWRFQQLPPVLIEAQAPEGTRFRNRGGSAQDWVGAAGAIPFGDDFWGGVLDRALEKLAAASCSDPTTEFMLGGSGWIHWTILGGGGGYEIGVNSAGQIIRRSWGAVGAGPGLYAGAGLYGSTARGRVLSERSTSVAGIVTAGAALGPGYSVTLSGDGRDGGVSWSTRGSRSLGIGGYAAIGVMGASTRATRPVLRPGC